jgi:site-specific recombinase XerD
MNIPVRKSLEMFLIDQELKGNTQKTIENYRSNITYFVDFLGDDKTTGDITLASLNEYQLTMKKKVKYSGHPFRKESGTISSTSLQSYIRQLRVYISWLFNEGYLETNLHEKFRLPKAEKKLVSILSDEEIEKLLNKYKKNTEMNVRNACVVALMLDSGLRISEVVGLNYDNVFLTQNIVKVFGKGQKERTVPVGTYTKKMLYKYMSTFRSMPEFETKSLFISKDKAPLTYDSVKMMFQRLRKSLGIDRLHPHLLRHTFATRYLMNGGDTISLQQILGHTSLEMVRKYSHLASSHLLNVHKKFSPIDNHISLHLNHKKSCQ